MFFALHLIIPLCFVIIDIVRIEYGIKIFRINEVNAVFYVFFCFVILHIHHYIKLHEKLIGQPNEVKKSKYLKAIIFSSIVFFISFLILVEAGKTSI